MYSDQQSSDEMNSIGVGNEDNCFTGGDRGGGIDSSGCDSESDMSWSTDLDMIYPRKNCSEKLSLLQRQHDDMNDISPTDNDTGSDERQIPILSHYSIDRLEVDEDGNDDDDNLHYNDSDEEFAMHSCLRGLIKSKSLSSMRKDNYHALISYAHERLSDGNTFSKPIHHSGKYLNDTRSVSDEENSTLSFSYFSQNQSYYNHRTPIFKTKSNINMSDNWLMPTNDFKYGMNFESNAAIYGDNIRDDADDDDDFDQTRSSPFTCCWSAPELMVDNEEQTSDELSSSEEACFLDENKKLNNHLSNCADICEYDEQMRASILDFNSQILAHNKNLAHLNLQLNVTCPKAISENDSLYMYDASPSPHRENEEINFADELSEMDKTVNKWTPEAVIDFAKKTFRENSETRKQLREKCGVSPPKSKSFGCLDFRQTELSWTRSVSSQMDYYGLAMRQSISCHDHMITSYVDCAIQNHYNRCSSPGCRKYAFKPDTVKHSLMNSGSDTSDDEWIQCADEVAFEDGYGNEHSSEEICAQVKVTLFPSSNNKDFIDQKQQQQQQQQEKQKLEEQKEQQQQQQYFNDLFSNGKNNQIKDNVNDQIIRHKQPITLLSVSKEVIVDDENMVEVTKPMDNFKINEFSSFETKNRYSVLIDPKLNRSYSSNMLDQISKSLMDFEKESSLLITEMNSNTGKEKYHNDDIYTLSTFKQHSICYQSMNNKNGTCEYISGENIIDDDDNIENTSNNNDIDNENINFVTNGDDNDDDDFMDQIHSSKRNNLPNIYKITFDVSNTIRNNTIKLLPNIVETSTLYSFLENYKSDKSNQLLSGSEPEINLWDDCCEYAQQINEIARIWLYQSSALSDRNRIIPNQTTFATNSKSVDLPKFRAEAIDVVSNQPPPFPQSPAPLSVHPPSNNAAYSSSSSSSSTVSVHRRLPPLPIDSLSTIITSTTNTASSTLLPVHLNSIATTTTTTTTISTGSLTMSTDLFSSPTIVSCPSSQQVAKEDHRICFGTESLMDHSMLLFEDSYYEDSNVNGLLSSRKVLSQFGQDDSSGVSSCCAGMEQFNPTHRVHSSFIPRHADEILLEIGDAIHVERECEDHWCYGINLRTNQHGIFPSAHVCEIDLVEEICMGALPTNVNQTMTNERDTFYLTMLASIEVAHHKGNDVLVQAMNKVLSIYQNKEEIIVPQTVLMEVSYHGIHIIDKRRKNFFQCPTFDFFYSLQNISFCGAHPKQLRYFGFITKHPLLPRFACHVFLSNLSTQPIVESIGRAFKRSYDEYMAFAHPTEDIYLE